MASPRDAAAATPAPPPPTQPRPEQAHETAGQQLWRMLARDLMPALQHDILRRLPQVRMLYANAMRAVARPGIRSAARAHQHDWDALVHCSPMDRTTRGLCGWCATRRALWSMPTCASSTCVLWPGPRLPRRKVGLSPRTTRTWHQRTATGSLPASRLGVPCTCRSSPAAARAFSSFPNATTLLLRGGVCTDGMRHFLSYNAPLMRRITRIEADASTVLMSDTWRVILEVSNALIMMCPSQLGPLAHVLHGAPATPRPRCPHHCKSPRTHGRLWNTSRSFLALPCCRPATPASSRCGRPAWPTGG